MLYEKSRKKKAKNLGGKAVRVYKRNKLGCLQHYAARAASLCCVSYAALFVAACVPPGPGGAPGSAGPMGPKGFVFSTVYFILLILLVYFALVIHPARLKEETHEKFIRGLKKNDEVVTSGGIFARVVSVKPEYVTLELASNVKVKVDPAHVQPAKRVDSTAVADQDKGPTKK
jgi:preprotein translocase subunit YajC